MAGMDMTTSPMLYKRTRTGAIEQWSIRVESLGREGLVINAGVIVTEHGQVGGKIQQTRDVVREGKNVGKKNETTPYQQATCEARAKWEKQKKKGYVETIEKALAEQVDEQVILGGINVMLAAKYADDGDHIVYPCFEQPKLDGHRCHADVVNGKATLWSRTRKPILSCPHIIEALERAFAGCTLKLDGELYNHEERIRLGDGAFQKLSGALRRSEPCPWAQYHVYDMPVAEGGFERRYHRLVDLFRDLPAGSPIRFVETIEVENEDEAVVAFEHFLAQSYEGAMLRNREGEYLFSRSSGDRSKNLQKMKKFDDAEFKIIGVDEGRGKLAGHAIFVCERLFTTKDPDGINARRVEFNAKMKGPQAQLQEYFQHAPRYIGQMLTVKYQGFYRSGAPRFPVAWRLREDI